MGLISSSRESDLGSSNSEEIAQGGMGIVYRARQPDLNRMVALGYLGPGPWFRRIGWLDFARRRKPLRSLNTPTLFQFMRWEKWREGPTSA